MAGTSGEQMIKLPSNPYTALLLGLALGGGGGTTLNSMFNTGLTDADLAKIESVVNRAVEVVKLETKLDIQVALEAHIKQYHNE